MNGNTEIEFVIFAKGHKVLYWDDIERQDNMAIALQESSQMTAGMA